MGPLLVCPECAYEWSPSEEADAASAALTIRDAVGNVLADGDTVSVIKDLNQGQLRSGKGRHSSERTFD